MWGRERVFTPSLTTRIRYDIGGIAALHLWLASIDRSPRQTLSSPRRRSHGASGPRAELLLLLLRHPTACVQCALWAALGTCRPGSMEQSHNLQRPSPGCSPAGAAGEGPSCSEVSAA